MTSNEDKPGCRDPAPPAGRGNNCSSAAALSRGPRGCQSVSLTLSTFQRLSLSLHYGVYIQSDLRVGRSGAVIFSSEAREAVGYGFKTVSDVGSTSASCRYDFMDVALSTTMTSEMIEAVNRLPLKSPHEKLTIQETNLTL